MRLISNKRSILKCLGSKITIVQSTTLFLPNAVTLFAHQLIIIAQYVRSLSIS